MKEIDLNIISINIPTKHDYYYDREIQGNKVIIKKHKIKKLRAQWTPELVADLSCYQEIDTEQEFI